MVSASYISYLMHLLDAAVWMVAILDAVGFMFWLLWIRKRDS